MAVGAAKSAPTRNWPCVTALPNEAAVNTQRGATRTAEHVIPELSVTTPTAGCVASTLPLRIADALLAPDNASSTTAAMIDLLPIGVLP